MFIVDAHLDLAYNALRGRDVLRGAIDQRTDADGIPSVGLPDLRVAGVGMICATLFCEPSIESRPGYRNSDEAFEMAGQQLAWYRERFADRSLARVATRDQVPSQAGASGHPLPAILLLEGADPIRYPQDVDYFFEQGVRIVGLAWRKTRYAGGTGTPGPLTEEGREIIRHMDRVGIIHDVSHLAEQSFWELLEATRGPVIASHSNCRAMIPTDRQLSDEMISAIARRGGIIGINFFSKFLVPPCEYASRRATLVDVVHHVRHLMEVMGTANQIGLGTDMDGGFGRDHLPIEIATAADLPRVADSLRDAGLRDVEIRGIMGENWRRFFAESLPPAYAERRRGLR